MRLARTAHALVLSACGLLLAATVASAKPPADKSSKPAKSQGTSQPSGILPGDQHHDDGHDGEHHDGDDSGCCRPRSKGWWHRQCMGADDINTGRGHGNGPGAHPQLSADELRGIIDRASRRTGARFHGSICQALDEENYRTPRGRAEAEYATLVLNREAGYLRGCGEADRCVSDAEHDFDAGRWDDCHRRCSGVNEGRNVHRCEGDSDDDHDGHHDGDDDDHDGHHDGDDDDHDGHHHDGDDDDHGEDHDGHGHGKSQGHGKKT